jgi:hypothetical protein
LTIVAGLLSAVFGRLLGMYKGTLFTELRITLYIQLRTDRKGRSN